MILVLFSEAYAESKPTKAFKKKKKIREDQLQQIKTLLLSLSNEELESIVQLGKRK
jgi:hypothetical protein